MVFNILCAQMKLLTTGYLDLELDEGEELDALGSVAILMCAWGSTEMIEELWPFKRQADITLRNAVSANLRYVPLQSS